MLPIDYDERPVHAAGPEELAEYLLPENIAERGRQAGLALGDDPVAAAGRSAGGQGPTQATSGRNDPRSGLSRS
ncbi:MAG: hypothetical protein ACT452_01110 [Microthrixaceae bacterium]